MQKLFRQLLRKPEAVPKGHVIRIPRWNDDQLSLQVAKLKAVHARLPFPTPEVVHYDVSEDNVLKMPYMIQKRIPGN